MQKLDPDFLNEEYMQQYIYEFGELKFKELASVIKSSQHVKDYVDYLIDQSRAPIPDEMQGVLNSHSFFFFAKEETICAGCLAIIHTWYGRTYTGYDMEQDQIRSQLITNTIMHCKKLKYNQFDNFFDRYIRRLSQKIKAN